MPLVNKQCLIFKRFYCLSSPVVKYAEVRSSEDRDPKGMDMECHRQEVSFSFFYTSIFTRYMSLLLRRAERLARLLAKHELRPILTCRTRNSATVRDLHFRWSQLAPATATLLYTRSTVRAPLKAAACIFFTPFPKTIPLFLRRFFRKFCPYEWLVIKSGL